MKTKFFEIADWLIAEWEEKFAPLNVRNELKRIEQFLETNPRRRRKAYSEFITVWLSRECAKVIVDQVNARAEVKSRVGR